MYGECLLCPLYPLLLELNQYFALTSYCNTIGQSNNAFSILGFFGGKTKSPCFDLFIHWLIKQIAITYRNHFPRSYENRSIQFIKPVAFSSLVADPWWRDRRGPDPNISIRQLLWNWNNNHRTIAWTFKHCSFKTTLVSHVLIKALVEIKEKCMAAGGWGIAPLLQKSNFCEPKRPNNFCNLSRRNFDRLSNNDQLFLFRTLTSCYAMLCYIYPYFKHRLCLHNHASKTLVLRPFR